MTSPPLARPKTWDAGRPSPDRASRPKGTSNTARYCKSQDGKLTLVFADKKDLMSYALSISETMVYLAEKYSTWQQDGPILAVLDIAMLEQQSGTSQALS